MDELFTDHNDMPTPRPHGEWRQAATDILAHPIVQYGYDQPDLYDLVDEVGVHALEPGAPRLWHRLPAERRRQIVDLDWHSLRHACGYHFYVTLRVHGRGDGGPARARRRLARP